MGAIGACARAARTPPPQEQTWSSIRMKSRRRISRSRNAKNRKVVSTKPTPTPIAMRPAAYVCVESGTRPKRQLVKGPTRGVMTRDPPVAKTTAVAMLQRCESLIEDARHSHASHHHPAAHVFDTPAKNATTASQKAKRWVVAVPCDVQRSILSKTRERRRRCGSPVTEPRPADKAAELVR